MAAKIPNSEKDELSTTGHIYSHEDDDENTCVLEKLNFLNSYQVFVVQKKTTVDYFSSNVTHEIMDHRKNLILKATRPRSIFSKKEVKVSIRNLKNVKLFQVRVESTNNLDSTGSEATIYLKSKTRIAHVEKYGGNYSPPCYEIFNADCKTAFTVDLVANKSSSSNTSILEYDVCTKKGTLANIMMKTGLNFILSTDAATKPVEKATLIAVILAMVIMDLLKCSTREKEPSSNQYLFQ